MGHTHIKRPEVESCDLFLGTRRFLVWVRLIYVWSIFQSVPRSQTTIKGGVGASFLVPKQVVLLKRRGLAKVVILGCIDFLVQINTNYSQHIVFHTIKY